MSQGIRKPVSYGGLSCTSLCLLAGCGLTSVELVPEGDLDAGTDIGNTDIASAMDSGTDPETPDGIDSGSGACLSFEVSCAGICINPSTSPAHCGGCDIACATGQVCLSSACVVGCPPGLVECDGSCVDTGVDSAHCGGCGRACSDGTGCVDSSCETQVVLGPAPAKCEGGGPSIRVQDGSGLDLCAELAAAPNFTFALCSCDAIGLPRLSGVTRIDAFDSTKAPHVPGGSGGGMAANGAVDTAELHVSGDLRSSAREDGLELRQTNVGQNLHARGEVHGEERLTVDGDAFVEDALEGERVTIRGTLHTPVCESVPERVMVGACVSEPVNVPDPCACDTDELLPIAAVVGFRSTNNDNAAVGLSADVFAGTTGPRRLDLPCGNYFLSEVGGGVTIVAHGRTALYIAGDVALSSTSALAAAPGASLDVFVGGTLNSSDDLRLGSPAAPRDVRVYVAGTNAGFIPPRSVSLEGSVGLAALVYAPNGAVSLDTGSEMYGSIFAGHFHNASSTTIHFDRSAANLGGRCADAPTACSSCRDCGNQACIDGMCDACTEDSQCCGPLSCIDGTCSYGPI